ncbi:MAG: DNA-formamidopyrimidine glycosylase [Bacillota bacterium]|nr:DNA-formamidopyrimidine glycosylase [Bacillota bacterium]
MPELPEVETVARTLRELVVGKRVQEVDVRLTKIVKYPPDPVRFADHLAGQTVRGTGRRGKYLKLVFDDVVLVSHMRMEGRYMLHAAGDPEEPHTHVVFRFTDGTELRYRDTRQFGTMHLFPKGAEECQPPLSALGPEPLDPGFSAEDFSTRLRARRTRLKALLLDQTFLAGLGNIYVDEALFGAGLHPERPAHTLTADEAVRLFHSIRRTLARGIARGGASVRSYRNGKGEMGMFQLELDVYGRRGEPCRRCGTPIVRIVVAGRGTHLCPTCQT